LPDLFHQHRDDPHAGFLRHFGRIDRDREEIRADHLGGPVALEEGCPEFGLIADIAGGLLVRRVQLLHHVPNAVLQRRVEPDVNAAWDGVGQKDGATADKDHASRLREGANRQRDLVKDGHLTGGGRIINQV